MTRIAALAGVAAFAAVAATVDARARTDRASQGVATQRLYASYNVPSRTVQNYDVQCPTGWSATSGGVISAGPGVTLAGVFGLTVSTWRFRAVNVSQQAEELSVVVNCAQTGRIFFVIGGSRTTVTVKPGSAATVTAPCPPGKAPTGAGFDLEPTEDRQSLVPTPLAVTFTTMRPLRGGWVFRLRNRGATVRARLHARCVTHTSRGRQKQRLSIVRLSRSLTLAAGAERQLTNRCRRNSSPLFAGWASTSREIDVRAFINRQKRGEYLAVNLSDRPVRLSIDLLCLGNKTRPVG